VGEGHRKLWWGQKKFPGLFAEKAKTFWGRWWLADTNVKQKSPGCFRPIPGIIQEGRAGQARKTNAGNRTCAPGEPPSIENMVFSGTASGSGNYGVW